MPEFERMLEQKTNDLHFHNDATRPTGKSLNSLGKLKASQISVHKKEIREGAPRGRYEWMKSKLLSERERRSLKRAWQQRGGERVEKRFQDRKRYLATRTTELQKTVDECDSLMGKLRNAIFKDISVLVVVSDGSDDAASAAWFECRGGTHQDS